MNMRISIKITSEAAYKILVALVWTQSILMDYARAVLLRIPIINIMPDAFIALVYLLFIIISIPFIARSTKLRDCTFYLIVSAIYIISILIVTDNEILKNYAFMFLISSLPLYFIGLNLDDGYFKSFLYKLSILSIVALLFYIMVLGGSSIDYSLSSNEDIYNAYKLLPHLLLVLTIAFDRPNIINIVISLIGAALLLSFGSRGPLVCVILFCALFLIIRQHNKTKSRVVLVVATCIICFLFDSILELLHRLAVTMGMSTRITSKLMDGSFFTHLSGRDIIQNRIINAISLKPWTGYGFAGDRAILHGLVDTYSHNIVLELLCSFGIPMGVVLTITLFVIIFRGYRSTFLQFSKEIFLVFFCSTILKLMVSGTYLNEPLLFLFLGLCVRNIRRAKQNINN